MPITTNRYSPPAVTHPDDITNEQHPESFQNGISISNNEIKEEDNYSASK